MQRPIHYLVFKWRLDRKYERRKGRKKKEECRKWMKMKVGKEGTSEKMNEGCFEGRRGIGNEW